jgi:hypothetical protein
MVLQCIIDFKDSFGLDQSQVRLYTAIARHTVLVMAALAICVCVPITSSTSCDQPVFVDHATDLSVSSETVVVEIDWLG